MKTFFRYHRNDERKPIETVCVLSTDDGLMYSKGHAICSDKDIPCKERGRSIAEGRALKAMNIGADLFNKDETFKTAIYMPELEGFEQRWIDRLRQCESQSTP